MAINVKYPNGEYSNIVLQAEQCAKEAAYERQVQAQAQAQTGLMGCEPAFQNKISSRRDDTRKALDIINLLLDSGYMREVSHEEFTTLIIKISNSL